MELRKELFNIDCQKIVPAITDFIGNKLQLLKRSKIVVPISGGLDSSVIASLCVEAVGKRNVVGLLLPEKEGNPEARRFAKVLAHHLDIKTKTINISKILKALGSYNFILSYFPGRFLKKTAVRKYMKTADDNLFLQGIRGEGNNIVRRGISSFYTKQRVRLVTTYKFAEEKNMMVVGSAHKSEDMVGLYVKFGIDDLADLMPLKYFYRSQILQLAEYLGVPETILARSPNPDLIPGISDKYKDILEISADNIDLILFGIENNMDEKEISEQLDIDISKVKMIRELIDITCHMRNPSMAPEIDL